MPYREPLATGEIYHVMSKSIAGYKVFNGKRDYARMLQAFRYFQLSENLPKLSQFLERNDVSAIGFERCLQKYFGDGKFRAHIIAYCLMPTHFHLILKQLHDNGISQHVARALNSYSHYFNTKYKRLGPLWVGRFKCVLVDSDEHFLHLTRYIHLNPTTAGLVKQPEDWIHSSYAEYVHPKMVEYPLCEFQDLFDMTPHKYQSFVNDHTNYQRELGKIKNLILE